MSVTLAIAGLVGAAASAAGVGVNWYYSSKSNERQQQQLELQKEQLKLQEQQYNESLRSNYYSYMQQLSSMEGEYEQDQLSINQGLEDIASNQNYLDRWASEYDQSINSAIDEAWSSYQEQASNYSSSLVSAGESGHKGGSSARVNQANALALKNLAGGAQGFTLSGGRLGSYVQSTALDMMADKQTALSAVSTGYKSIDSYKEAMKSLEGSISSMKKTTGEIENKLQAKGLSV